MIQKSIENIHKGDVFYADLGENVGSEQNGIRPVLVRHLASCYMRLAKIRKPT